MKVNIKRFRDRPFNYFRGRLCFFFKARFFFRTKQEWDYFIFGCHKL